jgi:murein DD-endopeptidase MepM/ murein hydrolase activator NlpD
MRQPNAAVPGFFAQARTYYHAGQAIDRQTHLGIDLASTAQAPVPAANAGTVVFADELGIYGNCVVIDHGLGLQTLYGHLSQITVQKGETVSKGQIVGRTGATGMAGGDHLHLSVLIAGQQVNPLEWWDPNWLKNNISDKLTLAGTAAR